MKFTANESYTCTHSKSPGYTVGNTYKCYKNPDGYTCLRGDDGYEDLTVMLISKFRKSDVS